MSTFYGTPEGNEITIKPHVHVAPVDDERMFCAAAIPERDFVASGDYGLKTSYSSFNGLREELRKGI